MTKIDIYINVDFSQLFDEQLPELEALLEGISRSRLMKFAAFFLGLGRNKSKFENYKKFIEQFFSRGNDAFGNEVYNKLLEIEKSSKGQLNIVAIQSMLQLVEYCMTSQNEIDLQTDLEIERNFFKAMLLLNEINGKNQEAGIIMAQKEEGDAGLAAMALTMNYAIGDLNNYDLTQIILGQFMRSFLLFEFLEKREETQQVLKAFLVEYKCNNWQEYIKNIYPIIMLLIKNDKEGIFEFTIEKNENFDGSCEFMDNFILSDSGNFEEGFDFRALRSHPAYRIEKGHYRIIFEPFFQELIYKGLYFKLKKVYDTLPKENKKLGDFRGYYCDYFSERELLYKTIRGIWGNKYIQHSGEEIKEIFKVNGELDYYMRNGNKAFIFESKDIFIKGEVKQSFNYLQYHKEFKEKLYCSVGKNGKIENKAVLQLKLNIEKLLTNTLPNDKNYKVKSLRIYPILVLHDRQFDVAGLNNLVNFWFNEELKELEGIGLDTSRVRPITIINIETFLLYQENFKRKDFSLDEIIDAYISYGRTLKKEYKSEDEMNDYVQRKLIPFSNFISTFTKVKGVNYPPKKMVLNFAEKLFNLIE